MTLVGNRSPAELRPPFTLRQLLTALRLNLPLAFAFAGSGVMLGAWATSIPAVVERLQLSWAVLGGTMGYAALGSWVMLHASPSAIERFGPGMTASFSATVSLAGLAGIEFARTPASLLVALLALGMGLAAWDLAMNVAGQAAGDLLRVTGGAVVRRPRTELRGGPGAEPHRFPLLLPLHGCFSLGAVAGAGIGAANASVHGTATWHLVVLAAVVVAVEWWAATYFTAPVVDAPESSVARMAAQTRVVESVERGQSAWHYVGWGLVALWAAVAEVLGNDWIALLLVDDYRQQSWRPGVAVVVFLFAMALGRFVAVLLVNRRSWRILRLGVLLCCLGVLVVAAPAVNPAASYVYPVVMLGAAVWGLGASAALPWAMQEAGKGRNSTRQMRTVQLVSSLAFLSPAAVGWFSGQLPHAWAIVVVLPVQVGLAVLALAVLGLLPPLCPARRQPAAHHVAPQIVRTARNRDQRLESLLEVTGS